MFLSCPPEAESLATPLFLCIFIYEFPSTNKIGTRLQNSLNYYINDINQHLQSEIRLSADYR